jgi:hypothetical protein
MSIQKKELPFYLISRIRLTYKFVILDTKRKQYNFFGIFEI